MGQEFNLEFENQIMGLITKHFGLEVFTVGLERSRFLFEKINTKGQTIITVGGTNGKGQTAYTLTHLLGQKGRVATWVSPHVMSIRERFSINGEMICYDELQELVLTTIADWKAINPEEIKISFYEFLFFIFWKYIENKKVKYVVLEVGMGGRLDAVNHFTAQHVVITSISRDHQEILGHRLSDILMEKLGVVHQGATLYTKLKLNYLNELVEKYAVLNGVTWHNRQDLLNESDYWSENESLAYVVASDIVGEALPRVTVGAIKGRHEVMTFGQIKIIFVGAHNIDGFRALGHYWCRNRPSGKTVVWIGFSKRSMVDLAAMMKMVQVFFRKEKENKNVNLISFVHPKALPEAELRSLNEMYSDEYKCLSDCDWKNDIPSLLNDRTVDQLLVFGSFYLLGEVQKYLQDHFSSQLRHLSGSVGP